MGLAVQLPLHKDVAPLLQVDFAVGAHETSRVAELFSGLHHCASAGDKREFTVLLWDQGTRESSLSYCGSRGQESVDCLTLGPGDKRDVSVIE